MAIACEGSRAAAVLVGIWRQDGRFGRHRSGRKVHNGLHQEALADDSENGRYPLTESESVPVSLNAKNALLRSSNTDGESVAPKLAAS